MNKLKFYIFFVTSFFAGNLICNNNLVVINLCNAETEIKFISDRYNENEKKDSHSINPNKITYTTITPKKYVDISFTENGKEFAFNYISKEFSLKNQGLLIIFMNKNDTKFKILEKKQGQIVYGTKKVCLVLFSESFDEAKTIIDNFVKNIDAEIKEPLKKLFFKLKAETKIEKEFKEKEEKSVKTNNFRPGVAEEKERAYDKTKYMQKNPENKSRLNTAFTGLSLFEEVEDLSLVRPLKNNFFEKEKYFEETNTENILTDDIPDDKGTGYKSKKPSVLKSEAREPKKTCQLFMNEMAQKQSQLTSLRTNTKRTNTKKVEPISDITFDDLRYERKKIDRPEFDRVKKAFIQACKTQDPENYDKPRMIKKIVNRDAAVAYHADFHGDKYSMFALMQDLADKSFTDKKNPFKVIDPNFHFTFLGDFSDRGQDGLETLYCALRLKAENPNNFEIVKGNHEDIDQNMSPTNGFVVELAKKGLIKKTSELELTSMLSDTYKVMPYAVFVGIKGKEKTHYSMFVHGGIDPTNEYIIHLIKKLLESHKKFSSITGNREELGKLLWNDFRERIDKHTKKSKRGGNFLNVSMDSSKNFLSKISTELAVVDCIHRGHAHSGNLAKIMVKRYGVYGFWGPENDSILDINNLEEKKYKPQHNAIKSQNNYWTGKENFELPNKSVWMLLVSPFQIFGSCLGYDFDTYATLKLNEYEKWEMQPKNTYPAEFVLDHNEKIAFKNNVLTEKANQKAQKERQLKLINAKKQELLKKLIEEKKMLEEQLYKKKLEEKSRKLTSSRSTSATASRPSTDQSIFNSRVSSQSSLSLKNRPASAQRSRAYMPKENTGNKSRFTIKHYN